VTSVFIIAEVRIYREGLALALARQAGIEVVGAGKGLDDLAAATPDLDVIILDMLIPSKLFILNALRTQRPATKVLRRRVSGCRSVPVAILVGVTGNFCSLPGTKTAPPLPRPDGEAVPAPRAGWKLPSIKASIARSQLKPRE
jgi:hypothetical protein